MLPYQLRLFEHLTRTVCKVVATTVSVKDQPEFGVFFPLLLRIWGYFFKYCSESGVFFYYCSESRVFFLTALNLGVFFHHCSEYGVFFPYCTEFEVGQKIKKKRKKEILFQISDSKYRKRKEKNQTIQKIKKKKKKKKKIRGKKREKKSVKCGRNRPPKKFSLKSIESNLNSLPLST